MLSGIPRRVDKRRVSGVAVTRHPVFVVSSLLVDAVDEHRQRHVASEIVFDLAAPASVEFGLNRFATLDDRHRIGVVVRVQQSETDTVVESAIQVDGLDAEVKAVKQFKKLSEDIAGGFASNQLANRQRVSFVTYPHIERRVRVKRSCSSFRLREVQRFCFVLVTVVRIKMEVEVCADLQRSIRKCRKRISL